MTLRVVVLDMRPFGRLPKGLIPPVQAPHPAVDVRVVGSDGAQVRLEVLHVDDVETNDGREEADVGLGEVSAEVVRPVGDRGQVRLDPVEGGEERRDGFDVGVLRRGEAGLVDAVVDVVVGPLVRGLDLGL